MEIDGQDPHGLDRVLAALANEHRRAMVDTLGLYPCAINQLAQLRGLSLPAIHKHIKVLESGGLIHRRKQGRTTYLILDRQSLAQIQDWVSQFHPYWGGDEATYENYNKFLGVTRPAMTSPPIQGDLPE